MIKRRGEHLIRGRATCQRDFRHVCMQTCLGLPPFPENDAAVTIPRALRGRGVPMAQLPAPAAFLSSSDVKIQGDLLISL